MALNWVEAKREGRDPGIDVWNVHGGEYNMGRIWGNNESSETSCQPQNCSMTWVTTEGLNLLCCGKR
jgi:hypothetical protein